MFDISLIKASLWPLMILAWKKLTKSLWLSGFC